MTVERVPEPVDEREIEYETEAEAHEAACLWSNCEVCGRGISEREFFGTTDRDPNVCDSCHEKGE